MKNVVKFAALLFCMTAMHVTAQEKEELNSAETPTQKEVIPTVQHTVQMGETVLLISKKYVVSPDDIYKLNPEAIDGITPGMVLSIPSEKKLHQIKHPINPKISR
jgi:LysM repeat protein